MSFLLENKTKPKMNNHGVEHQITANPEEETSQVNDFSALRYMQRSKNLGSLKVFLRYAS